MTLIVLALAGTSLLLLAAMFSRSRTHSVAPDGYVAAAAASAPLVWIYSRLLASELSGYDEQGALLAVVATALFALSALGGIALASSRLRALGFALGGALLGGVLLASFIGAFFAFWPLVIITPVLGLVALLLAKPALSPQPAAARPEA